MVTLPTHSLPITTGSGQTSTHYSISYLCISRLLIYQIWSMQILPPSHPAGNSPIGGKITVPTGVSFIYDHPTTRTQPTVRLESITEFTTVNPVQSLPYVPTQRHRSFKRKRTIDHIVDHYIPLGHLEKSSPEHTKVNATKYTYDLHLPTFLEHTISKYLK